VVAFVPPPFLVFRPTRHQTRPPPSGCYFCASTAHPQRPKPKPQPTARSLPNAFHPLSSSDSLRRLLGLPSSPCHCHRTCCADPNCGRVSNGAAAAAATEAAAPCVRLGCHHLPPRELRFVSSPWTLDFVGVIEVIGCAFGLMAFCCCLQQGLEASESVRRAMELRLVLG
jgi:hypothetical protein